MAFCPNWRKSHLLNYLDQINKKINPKKRSQYEMRRFYGSRQDYYSFIQELRDDLLDKIATRRFGARDDRGGNISKHIVDKDCPIVSAGIYI
jgi:hypothetical protein